MAQLPPMPAKGEPLRATWAQQLLNAVRALRVTAGPGLVSHQSAAGTTIALAPPPPSAARARVVADVFAARITGTEAGAVYTVALYDPSDPGAFARSVGSGRLVLPETSQLAPLPVGAVVLAHAVEVAVEASAVEEGPATEEES